MFLCFVFFLFFSPLVEASLNFQVSNLKDRGILMRFESDVYKSAIQNELGWILENIHKPLLIEMNGITMSLMCKQDSNIAFSDLNTLIDKIVETNPISFLMECTGDSCPLAQHNSNIREKIIGDVLNVLSQQNPKQIHLNYVSIGAGNLLYDAKLLITLIKSGYSLSSINLIDKNYAGFIDIYKNANQAREEYLQYLHQFAQFQMFLETYLKQSIYLGIFASIDDYKNAVANKQVQASNLAIAMDLVDGNNPVNQVENELHNFIFNGLEKNGILLHAFNNNTDPLNQFAERYFFRRTDQNIGLELLPF